VLANDVSARDVQLPQGQWYKGKSYRTFCPVGPYLCIPDPDEVSRWRELRLTLSVNGQPRQDSLAGDMVFQPAATLTEFSQLEDFQVGDLLLTGTPGGVALQPPNAVAQRIVGLLPEAKKWELFVRNQARSSAYLKPGDRVTASIRTADGALDLGTQHNAVR
jgi:2-keto-4-pentenoate hydratase/2-oxohepta-3-ene-1,7-dioic acid hydratase in catechol pathway